MQKLDILPVPDYQIQYGSLTQQSCAKLEVWVSQNISHLLELGGAKRTVPVAEGLKRLARELTNVLIQVGYREGYDSASMDIMDMS
jgi:hypothetical protein